MEFGRGIPCIPRAGGRGLPMMDRQTAEERSPAGWGQMRLLLRPLPPPRNVISLLITPRPGKRRQTPCKLGSVSQCGVQAGGVVGRARELELPQSHPHAPTN